MTTTEKIFQRIGQLINNSNGTTYIITGYKLVETRLVLQFHDCNQVFDFNQVKDENGEWQVKETSFFTKDIDFDERMIIMGEFKELHEKEVPEEIVK